MVNGDPRYREVILDNLRRIDRERGFVTNEQVRRAAPLLGVTERHVRKLIRKKTKDREGPWKPDDRVIDVFYATKGNIAATVAECERLRIPIPVQERQAQRAFERFVDRTLIGGARGGVDGFRKSMLTVPVHVPHRNAEHDMDHTVAPVLLRPEGAQEKPWQPWVSSLQDRYSGLFLAAYLSADQPNSDDSMETLALGVEGITLRDGTFAGGVPDLLLTDRGGDFLATAANIGLIGDFRVERRVTGPRQPQANGSVERLQGVWQQKAMTRLPGFVFGDRDSYERKRADAERKPSRLLTFDQFRMVFADAIERYNEDHIPRRDGASAAAQYAACPHPIRRADPRALRLALMTVGVHRKVDADGIEFRGHKYWGDCLADHVGRSVEIRAMRRNEDFIEVLVGGSHIGRVGLAKDQTDASRGRLVGKRLAQQQRHAAHVRQGDIINAEKVREFLSDLGVPEEDLPEVPPAPGQENEQQPSGRRKVATSSQQRKARAKATTDLTDHIDGASSPDSNGRKKRSNGNGHGTPTDTAPASPDALTRDGRATATTALLDLIEASEN